MHLIDAIDTRIAIPDGCGHGLDLTWAAGFSDKAVKTFSHMSELPLNRASHRHRPSLDRPGTRMGVENVNFVNFSQFLLVHAL